MKKFLALLLVWAMVLCSLTYSVAETSQMNKESKYCSGLTEKEIIERILEIPKEKAVEVSSPVEMDDNITAYPVLCGNTGFGLIFKSYTLDDGIILFFPLDIENESDIDFYDWFDATSFVIQSVDPSISSYESMQCVLSAYEDGSCIKNGIKYDVSENLILTILKAEQK